MLSIQVSIGIYVKIHKVWESMRRNIIRILSIQSTFANHSN